MNQYRQVYIDNTPTEYFVSRDGDIISKYKNNISHPKVFTTEKGYQYVKLWFNSKTKAQFVHRLVAKAFIENPKNKPEVNHIDGVKSHNHVDNLEWVTSKENKDHAKRTGLLHYNCGEDTGTLVYTNDQIHEVCLLMELNNMTVNEISDNTGVSCDTIYGIRSKGIWSEIAKNYNIPAIQKRSSRAYTEEDIRLVCKLLENGKSRSYIVTATNVKKSTINDIIHRRRWTYVSKDYNIDFK